VRNIGLAVMLNAAWIAGSPPVSAAGPLQTFDNTALLACAAISDDRQRLHCFDSVVAHRSELSHSQKAFAAEPEHNKPPPTVAAVPPAAAVVAVPAPGPQFRLAAGYGFGVGDHTGSFRVLSGDLNLQSAVGSSGDMVSGQFWIDRWIAENWTIGLEYVGIRNEGKLSLTLPKGVSILTDPVGAEARVKVRADMGFLNLAYRQASGFVHPFIGAGIGVGYGHASAGFGFSNAFLGSVSEVVAAGSPIAGVQGFTGVEVDLGRHAYVAVMPRVIVVDAHPIGIDQRYMEFGVNGILGWRF
jgi:hypothetical protein